MLNLLSIIFLLSSTAAYSQHRKGFEEYYFPATAGLPALSSKVFYETDSKWHTEARYNYEAENSLGCSVGKTFEQKGGSFDYSFTPIAGLTAGRLQGASFGLNSSLSYKSVSLSSSLQFISSLGKNIHFLFGWTELNWQLSKYFFGGLSLQQSGLYPIATQWDPGIQFGISIKNWTFPVYVFNPTGCRPYLAMGLCREWN